MALHPLFEELQAFDPRYAQRYPTLRAAAKAAGCEALLEDYLRSEPGRAYIRNITSAPDVLGAQKQASEAADRLPYTLDTIGLVKDTGET